MKAKAILLAIVLLLIALVGCKVKTTGMKPGQQDLQTATVEKGSIVVKIEETGVIEPVRDVDIKTKVGGKVVRLFVHENDKVALGQLIADIEPTYEELSKISSIQIGLKQAEIRLNDAKRDVEEQRQLIGKYYTSKNDLKEAEDELVLAQLNYDDMLRQYELVKEIDLEASIWHVKATAAGTIISLPVEEGEMVRSDIGSYSEGTVIAVVADLQDMIVSTSINEADIAKLHLGQEAGIRVDALPYMEYKGTVTQIAAMAQEVDNVKVFDVDIAISNPDAALKPGLTANVTIIGEKRADIMVVPIRAIFADRDGMDIVWRVENGAVTDSVVVKTGINDFTRVEIIEGLKEGDTISLTEPARAGEDNKQEMTVSF